MKPYICLILSLLLGNPVIYSQEAGTHTHTKRCNIDKQLQKMREGNGEAWQNYQKQQALIARKIKEKGPSSSRMFRDIPVVFHICHFGDALGTVNNPTDARIQDQVQQLTDDFGLPDLTNNQPTSVTMIFDAENPNATFCLAQIDEGGNPTTGITRTNLNTLGITNGDCLEAGLIDNTIQNAIWWAGDYLNIWVLPRIDEIDDNNDCQAGTILGYTYLPMPGVQLALGIVIAAPTVGSIANANPDGDPFSNNGRTLTHETGHYFGLQHLWGADLSDCTVDDGLADTPAQDEDYNGDCTMYTALVTPNSCSSDDMVSNFMTYNGDGCMNMFTIDQVNVMHYWMDDFWQYESYPCVAVVDECPPIWVLDDTDPGDISTAETYNASSSIEATHDILNGADVNYTAGDFIELLPGFEVEYGADFLAIIADCPPERIANPLAGPTFMDGRPEVQARPALDPSDSYSIFPNPFSNEITISGNSPVELIGIYNVNGQLIQNYHTSRTGDALKIQTHQLAPGVYVISFSHEGKLITHKLMKR